MWIASFKAFFSKFCKSKFLLEFLRYLLAVFDVIKVLILRKKTLEPIFYFLILWFKKKKTFYPPSGPFPLKNKIQVFKQVWQRCWCWQLPGCTNVIISVNNFSINVIIFDTIYDIVIFILRTKFYPPSMELTETLPKLYPNNRYRFL